MTKTILITGGAGYIGSHVVKYFLDKNFKIIILDNLSRGYREAIEILQSLGEITFVEGDVLDSKILTRIFSDYKIDTVFHLAALCRPDESVEKPDEYYQTNLLGTVNILEAMKQADVKKIIFASTCAVYGEAEALPITEQTSTKPISPYGLSKLLAEQAIDLFHRLNDFSYIIFRFFNVCGADHEGMIGDSKKPSQLLVQNAVRGALGIEPFAYTCPQVATPDGTPIRDYVDVEDLAQAFALASDYLDSHQGGEIINLGSGQGQSVKQIVNQVEKALNVVLEKKQVKPRPVEYAAVYANITKAHNLLAWQPKKSLQESINSLIKWYNKHPRGYKY